VTLRKYESLVERNKDRVYRYAAYLVGNREDAEDITQEVFIRMWNHRHEIKVARAGSWLLRVTRNASLDAIRRRKLRTRSVLTDQQAVDVAPERTTSPYDMAEASRFRALLNAAITRLPETQRSIVVLREMEGLQYEEISAALDMPLNTVKVYLHRARIALRRELQDAYSREYNRSVGSVA
jgi:RNA polymerase sigma-70 factor (ECF subfamily)